MMSSMICKKISLDSRAIAYIRESLSSGHSLAKRLLSRDLSAGNTITLLPEDAKIDSLYDFTLGGKLQSADSMASSFISEGLQWTMVPIANADECLAEYICEFLKLDARHICLCQNALATATDPWLEDVENRYLFFHDEVYCCLMFEEASQKTKVVDAIKDNSSIGPPSIIILTKNLNVYNFTEDRLNITARDLDLFASGTVAIIVGAYDGESYVIWRGL
jgi:hypothetical protein